jgi:Na+(H+)/acetate symporter ActP
MLKYIILLSVILFIVFLVYRKIKKILNTIYNRLITLNELNHKNYDKTENEIIYKKDDIEVLKGEAKRE